MLFYSIAFLVAFLDQFIKALVRHSFALGQSVTIPGNLVKLTHVRNTGAAFSLFLGFSSYLLAVGILVCCAVIYFHCRVPKNNYWLQIGLACLLGGSLGNLVDRISRGFVTDYIDFGFFPVFNLADIMINLGSLLIIINFLKAPTGKKEG